MNKLGNWLTELVIIKSMKIYVIYAGVTD